MRYSPIDIFQEEIERIEISNLDVELVIPEVDDTPEKSEVNIEKALRNVRPYLISPSVRIDDIDLKFQYKNLNAALLVEKIEHEPNSDQFIFTGIQTTDHLQRITKNQTSTLTWAKKTFTIDSLKILQNITLNKLHFDENQNVTANANICGAMFSYALSDSVNHKLQQAGGALSLKEAAAIWDPKIPVEGFISNLNLSLNETKSPLPEFDLSLDLSNPAWDGQSYPDATAALSNDNKSPQGKITLLKGAHPAHLTLRSPQEVSLEQWQNNKINFEIHLPLGHHMLTTFDENIQGLITAKGELVPNLENPFVEGDWTIDLKKTDEPKASIKLNGHTVFQDQLVKSKANAFQDELQATFDYSIEKNTYDFTATSTLKDSQKLNPIIRYFLPNQENLSLTDQLTFTAKGSGSLEKASHQGEVDCQEGHLSIAEQPPIRLKTSSSWDWPKLISVQNLQAVSGKTKIHTAATWQDNIANISSLTLIHEGQTLATAKGTLPAPLVEAEMKNQLLNLKINSQPLSLNIIRQFFPIPESLQANFKANLDLTGSYQKPQLNGNITATQIKDNDYPKLPTANFNLDFKTLDQRLLFTGKAAEVGGPLLDLSGSIPFLPEQFLGDDPPEDLPLTLDLLTPELNLDRLKPFLPNYIRKLQGSADIDLKIRGSIKQPTYLGKANLILKKGTISESPISDFRDSTLKLEFNEREITVQPSTFIVAGGKILLSGKVDLTRDEPHFNLALSGQNTLLWRNEIFSLRSNPQLKLTGPYSAALFTGSIPLVESIIYKDLDILPVNLAQTTGSTRPNLPQFKKNTINTNLPQPFSDWLLDIDIKTADPILVRGNLASGSITADTRIRGTLGQPSSSGNITVNSLTASLPLSTLKITNGKITLNPREILNPSFNIRGTSSINSHDVQLFLTGNLNNPRTSFSSSPPLPENEILSLLATGSTTTALGDQQLASQKALQYLVEGLRRKYAKPNGNSAFQRLLKNADEVKLNLGEDDPYSGRRFTSATLELSRRWNLSAAIDDQGHSRALMIYSLRFK